MRAFVSAVALAAFALTSTVAQAADPIVIKFAHVVAENTPKGQAVNRFKALVDQRLGGKVQVEVYPNAQLFGDDKVLEAMLLGDVQMAAASLSKFDRYTKKLQVFDLPFLFQDINAVSKFMSSKDGKQLLRATERRGLVGLGFLHNGMKQLSATQPLRTPQDAAGLTFRIQTSDVLAAQFAAVNATPLKKPFADVFTLLQTQAIDGQENTWSNIYSKKFFEVQDYITESDHGYLGYLVVTSKEFWNGLPAEIRAELEQAIEEAIAYGNQIAQQKADSDKAAIAASGRSQIVKLSNAERQQWVQAMKPVWAKFKGEIGADLIESAANSGL